MQQLLLLVVLYLLLVPASLLGAEAEYGYPIRGAFQASILGTPAQLKPKLPVKIHSKKLVLDLIPERETPPVFFYNEGLYSTFAYQKKKAPLVFLIAAYGASNLSQSQTTLMKTLYQAGFHVITLPSSTHPNFIISASTCGIPGDLTEDAVDMYRAMEAAWNQVKSDTEVSEFYLAGTSLGATQAAFVAKLDEERKVFNFAKVLLINPPVSLYTSVSKIEEFWDKIPEGPKGEGVFFNRMLKRFVEYYRAGNFIAINEDFLYAIYQEGLFSNDEAGGLIALSYRVGLAGQIFTSDVVTNSGYIVPKNRVLEFSDSLSDYFHVATHLSFLDYFNEHLFPYFQRRHPGLTREAFLEAQGLHHLDGYLRSNPKFGAMINENDFVLTAADLEYLQQLFGPRAKVYPWGGHLGNLEYKENLAYMVSFFKGEGGK